MKYACFTVGQPETTPEETLHQLKEAGYDGAEFRVTKDDGDTSSPGFWKGNRATLQADWSEDRFREIADLTRDLGLEVPTLGTYLACDDLDAVRRMMEVANIFGAPMMRVNSGRYDGSRRYNELFDENLAAFERLVPLVEEHGVKVLIEMHPGNITPSASAAYRFVSHFSPEHVGTIHDAGNMVNEGFENYQMGFELLGPYLAHVHVKNGGWTSEPAEPPYVRKWKGVAVPMRSGIVDYAVVLRALKRVGYDGWLSFEDFSREQDQATRVNDNLAFIKDLAAAL